MRTTPNATGTEQAQNANWRPTPVCVCARARAIDYRVLVRGRSCVRVRAYVCLCTCVCVYACLSACMCVCWPARVRTYGSKHVRVCVWGHRLAGHRDAGVTNLMTAPASYSRRPTVPQVGPQRTWAMAQLHRPSSRGSARFGSGYPRRRTDSLAVVQTHRTPSIGRRLPTCVLTGYLVAEFKCFVF